MHRLPFLAIGLTTIVSTKTTNRMKVRTVTQLLEAVNLAIVNTLANKALQQKLSSYGFTPKRMQEGKALWERVQQTEKTQRQYYTSSRQVAEQIKQDTEAARDLFREHVAVARTAYRKEPLVIQDLGVQRMVNTKLGWIAQAQKFYEQAPQYAERLGQYGAPAESLQQNHAAVEALVALRAQRFLTKGDAEDSTQEKVQSLQQLRAWYGEFRKIARIAFQDNPQRLETYGIVVSAPRRKRSQPSEA